MTYPQAFTEWDKTQLEEVIRSKAPILTVPRYVDKWFHKGHRVSPTSWCMTPLPLNFEQRACFCGKYLIVREATS